MKPNSRSTNLSSCLMCLGAWMTSRSAVILVSIVVAIGVLRNGIRFSPWEPSIDLALVALPSAANYNSSAIFSLVIAAVIPSSLKGGALVTLIPQLVTLILVALLLRRRLIFDTHGRASKAQLWAVILAFSLSPIATLLMGNGGFARDWVPLLGLAIFVTACSRPIAIAGVVLASLGNPEQTVFALAIVLIATWSPALRNYRRITVHGLMASFVIFIPVQIWQAASGSDSRAVFLIRNWNETLGNFAPDIYIAAYASFSASWVIVVLWLANSRHVGIIWPILLGLFLGYVIMALTTDGTRVFTIVTSPLLLMAILSIVQAPEELVGRSEFAPKSHSGILGLILVAGLLMPPATWAVNAVLPSTSSTGSVLGVARSLIMEGLNGPAVPR